MEEGFYERFYRATERNPVHAAFCRTVFGGDLCQHGFADVAQIDLAISLACLQPGGLLLELGCGNGKTADYIHRATGVRVLGIDASPMAIRAARKAFRGSDGLAFRRGDLNDLRLVPDSADAILMVDSIYFSTDYGRTIRWAADALRPGGRLLAFYSIGPALLGTVDFPPGVLEPDSTPIAQALHAAGLEVAHRDLTADDLRLAVRRKEYLEPRREEWERAGIGFIRENRLGDANDISAFIARGKHRRYLYVGRKAAARNAPENAASE
jgi:SAM-dependent methyltransferase